MAMNSPDPGIFRWAWALCQFRDAPPICGQLSVLRLVEQHPEDAAHWLLLAQVQPVRAPLALQGVLQASAFSSFPSLTPWVESALPADLAPYLRMNLLGQSMRWGQASEAVMNAGSVAVARDCLAADADRSACLRLADVLDSRAPDLLGLHLAGRIGEVHGWQPQRIEALRGQLERLQQASDIGPVDASPWSCANVERNRRFLRDRAAYGEVEALHRLAAASAPAAAPR
ncbi:hypothetical protein IP87_02590 [beta proteobacterium AAP121]|nr:hypothetical protein IP80_20135 [beta proteobacterium AAP65]KPG00467.1 hypothetical protein IP87_02590 [beta proteobacterium AAP121]